MPQFLSADRRRAIAQLNREHPLNVAAGELLPVSWRDMPESEFGSSLNVLSLALFGMTEGGLHLQPRGGWFVTDDHIDFAILELMECDPEKAMRWIQGYESDESGSVEVSLFDDALDDAETTEDGAWTIIEQIACQLDTGRPLPPVKT